MAESKIELVERWRREGRAEETTHYREEVREQLRAQGKTRREAREGSWEAARAAFPPLPPAENPPEPAPVVRATEPAAEEGYYSSDEKDWVAKWFNDVPTIAQWQADHGVALTDGALRDLLEHFGFASAWAWMLGARGDRPKGCADRPFTYVAALIDMTYAELAQLVSVDNLGEFRSAEPAPSGQ